MKARTNSLTGVPNSVYHQVISANLPAAARFEIQGRVCTKVYQFSTKVHNKNNTSCGEKSSLENLHSTAIQNIKNSHVLLESNKHLLWKWTSYCTGQAIPHELYLGQHHPFFSKMITFSKNTNWAPWYHFYSNSAWYHGGRFLVVSFKNKFRRDSRSDR
jgi:hypothetical protein